MSSKKVVLSSNGLQNVIPRKNSDDEFEFIFGNHRIRMNNIFADFISPTVSRIHASDPMINSINFTKQINDFSITDDVLSLLQLLSKGFSVEIREDQVIQMQALSIILDNKELFTLLNEKFDTNINEENIDHYLTYLKFFYQISPASNFIDCSSIIKCIASHFYSIDETKILSLPREIIHSIISSEYLVIESEDSLFEFIEKLFIEKDNDEFVSFLEEVDFEKLSECKFNHFIENFSGGKMTAGLWQKLRKCFYTSMKNQKELSSNKNRYSFHGKKIEFDGNESHRFDGIINYLTQKSGGNVSDNGTVKVTSSSYNGSSYPKYAVDVKNCQNFFQTENQEKEWIQYDFIQNRVCPTRYSIRTRHDCDWNHPRSWVIEGSNTGGSNESEWTVLDSHTNDATLKGVNFSYTFDIKNSQVDKKGYRYLRMKRTGPTSNGNNHMALSALEYFGYLIEK